MKRKIVQTSPEQFLKHSSRKMPVRKLVLTFGIITIFPKGHFEKSNPTPLELLFTTMHLYCGGHCNSRQAKEFNEHDHTLRPFEKTGNLGDKVVWMFKS